MEPGTDRHSERTLDPATERSVPDAPLPDNEAVAIPVRVRTDAADAPVPVPDPPHPTTSTESASFLVTPDTPSPKPDRAAYHGPGSAAAGSTDPHKPTALDAPFNGALQPPDSTVVDQGSLLDDTSTVVPDAAIPEPPKPVDRKRLLGLGLVVFGVMAALALGARLELAKSQAQENRAVSPSAQLKAQQLPTTSLSRQLAAAQTASSVTVNGQLQVTSSLVLQPSTLTGPAVTGQMYYDAATNTLAYYNGTKFVSMQGGGNTYVTNNGGSTSVTNVTNITNSGGGFGGNGTTGTLALFASSTTLGDSLLSQNGSAVSVASNTVNVGTSTGMADIQGGDGGISMVTTSNTDGSSGSVDIISGDSATTTAGAVTVDTGVSAITGVTLHDWTFEDPGQVADWSTNYIGFFTLTQDCTVSHSGSCSMNQTGYGTGGGSYVDMQQNDYHFTLTPGHQYIFSVWVKAATTPAPVGAWIYGLTNCATPAQDDSATQWTHLELACTAGAGQTYGWFIMGFGSPTVETHYWDDISATDVSASSAYSQVNVGATNAQKVTVGNLNEIGPTTILGSGGIVMNSGLGTTSLSGGEVNIVSGDAATVSGAGSVTISTDEETGVTGTVSIESGVSDTTAAGDVIVDTGAGAVTGVVEQDKTFEDGMDNMLDGYNFADTLAQSTVQAHGGNHSLSVTVGNDSGLGGYWEIAEGDPHTVAVTPGHTYLFSIWVRAGSNASTIKGNASYGDTELDDIQDVQWGVGTDNSSGWTQISGTLVAPPSARYVAIYITGSYTSIGEVHYIDDMTITDMSASATTSHLKLGATNAQSVTLGNNNEIGATTILGSSGININSNLAAINIAGGSIALAGSGASSFGTTSGSLTLSSGGGAYGGVIVRPQGSSTTAFQVQGPTANLLTVDTTNDAISLGTGAGSSIGYTGLGNHSWLASGMDTIMADKFTTTSGGTVASMTAYIGSGGIRPAPNNEFQFAIYSDNAGAPGSYLASSGIGTMTTAGQWDTLPITATLAPSTTYWFVYWQNSDQNDSSNGLNYQSGVSGAVEQQNTYPWQTGTDNGMPATFPTTGGSHFTNNGLRASIYASLAGGGPALTINQYGGMTQSGAALFQDPTDSTVEFQVEDSLGNALLTVDSADGQVDVTNLSISGHIITSGTTPGIAAGAAACASPPAPTVSGNDTSGTISLTTGTGCTGGGTLVTITFANGFGTPPHVVLTPGSAATAGLNAYADNNSVSTSGFSIGTGATPAASTPYQWNYIVVQ